MQGTNFITQLILDIKLNHYLLSFWEFWGMSDHTHLKQPTNICCFHGPLVTSKNSASYLNLFVRYSSLKNPAFWLVQRFLDHNSRNRFFPEYHKQKSIYISKWIRFFYTLKTSFLGLFEPSKSTWTFSQESVTFLILWCLSNCITRPNTTRNYSQ